MNSSRDDVLDLFGYVWQRFRTRMEGLGDEEWRWQPSRDDRVTLRWRLGHIADTLRADRNALWLGLGPGPGAVRSGAVRSGAVRSGAVRTLPTVPRRAPAAPD